MNRRASGVLLPISSLPSGYGIGDLGPAAYRFVDFLAKAGQRYWQVLPLNPIDPDRGSYSPYDGTSAFAGNPLLISPDLLFRQDLLRMQDLTDVPVLTKGQVQYRKALALKTRLWAKAHDRFKASSDQDEYRQFCRLHGDWLDDYALFVALHRRFHRGPWQTWPAPLRDRSPKALAEARRSLAEGISQVRFEQYLFFRQWQELKDHGRCNGVAVIGDVPIYVSLNSADVWANPGLFALTRTKRPRLKAGVPPDAFSRTGQLWGNPVYDWSACRKQRFAWWLQRIRHNLALFDRIRLDHFRGFAGFWAVRSGQRTAAQGRWYNGPGQTLIGRLLKEFPAERFIAEDLGHITDDVRNLIQQNGLASMRVLQFAFDGSPATNPHYPHHHGPECVVYTGTHDNNTAIGWFKTELDGRRRKEISHYVGHLVTGRTVHEDLIRLALGSPAQLAIIPMQDILGLGSESRMNCPATTQGNWTWQMRQDPLGASISQRLKGWTGSFGRGYPLDQREG
jgi:4-alpha-glucanotransferase